MKTVATGVCLSLFLSAASGQERLPRDEARRYARVCVEQAADLADSPVKADADPDRACAVRGEGGGAMAVPDRKLSAEDLRKAGEGVVPVGQLWLRKWRPVLGGKAVPDDRLRVLTVNVDDKDRPMPVLLLGVRKKARGLELVAYAAGEDPLLALPLKGVDFIQDLPVELEWQRGEGSVDSLQVTIAGKYQAVLHVTRAGK